ncbi:hypothetical protein ACP70R_011148 [Stipagrostis hirtigluma subsp. patula]
MAAEGGEEALPAQVEAAAAAVSLELRVFHLSDQGVKELGRLELCGRLPPATLQEEAEATIDGGAVDSQAGPGFYLAIFEGGEIKDLAHLSSLEGHHGANKENAELAEGKAPAKGKTSGEKEKSVEKGKDGSGEQWEESSKEEEENWWESSEEEEEVVGSSEEEEEETGSSEEEEEVVGSSEEEEEEAGSSEEEEEQGDTQLHLQVRIWPAPSLATLILFSGGRWNLTREYRIHWLKDDQKEDLLGIIGTEGNEKQVLKETNEFDAAQPRSLVLNTNDMEGTVNVDLIPTMDHFEVSKQLGKGASGKVYQCAYTGSTIDAHYALKMIKVEEYDDIDMYNSKEPREVNILSCLKDPNVVTFFERSAWTANECSYLDEDGNSYLEQFENASDGSADTESLVSQFGNVALDDFEFERIGPKYIFILMEYCIGTLKNFLSIEEREINVEQSWTLFEKISEAVKCIHQDGVIHRDLKPDNIFIGSGGRIKIGDFGHACWAASHIDGQEGTPDRGTELYAAPELYSGQVTNKVDIYSLGVIFVEMFHPFQSDHERCIVLMNLKESIYPTEWEGDSVLMKKLTASCPSDRPSASDVLEHIGKRQRSIDG